MGSAYTQVWTIIQKLKIWRPKNCSKYIKAWIHWKFQNTQRYWSTLHNMFRLPYHFLPCSSTMATRSRTNWNHKNHLFKCLSICRRHNRWCHKLFDTIVALPYIKTLEVIKSLTIMRVMPWQRTTITSFIFLFDLTQIQILNLSKKC